MSGRISKAERTGGKDWPEGYKKLANKIYHQTKLCVPESLRLEYSAMLHEASSHAGTSRLANKLGSRAIVSNTQKLAAAVVQHCQECQAMVWPNQKRQGEMGPQPMAKRPFQSIASDIFKLGTIEDDVEGKVDGVLLTTANQLAIWRHSQSSKRDSLPKRLEQSSADVPCGARSVHQR